MIVPKCKSCAMARECAMPRLMVLETRRQDADFLSTDYRTAEFDIARLTREIREQVTYQEPLRNTNPPEFRGAQ